MAAGILSVLADHALHTFARLGWRDDDHVACDRSSGFCPVSDQDLA